MSAETSGAACQPATVIHSGFVNKLTGKGLLTPGSWKRRFCVLDAWRLYFYDTKEDQQQQQQPQQQEEEAAPPCQLQKTSNYINLQLYESCDEANIKEVRKATNVFVINPVDKSTFFETGRIFLSADTLTDMKEWIQQIRVAMDSAQTGSTAEAAVEAASPHNKKRSPLKSSEDKFVKEAAIIEEASPAGKAPKEQSVCADLSISSAAIDHLVCVTKQRAKGPLGRRLPRQRTAALTAEEIDDAGRHQRSESLPRIEPTERVVTYHNRSFDLLAGDQEGHATSASKSLRTVYAYSSSDDSLDASFSASEAPFLKSFKDETDTETCETLCETTAVKLHSSTPSISANPFDWGTPKNGRRSNKSRASSIVWTPDVSFYSDNVAPLDGSAPRALQSLHNQTLQLKSTLAQLETDSSASRRDMGSLQENLTTVQNAAASVADKVVKMQLTVINMERQIMHAVKEVQNVQQRATEALNCASAAEKHFRQMEAECQTLLAQLRNQRPVQADESADRGADVVCSPCISPMTPSGPCLLTNAINNNASNNNNIFNGSATFSPLVPRAFAIPQTFDFAALLAKSSAGSVAAGSAALPAVAHEMPKMKSSLRGEARSGSKSISFGPITTFNAPPSPITDQQSSNPPANLIPDFNVAVATSTLKKPSSSSSH